jgi:molybdenum ABC transporter molybdate-binding protein
LRTRREGSKLGLVLAAACVLACWLVSAPMARAGELRVLCPNALRTPVLESARSFARAGGHRLEFTFASVAGIHKRVASGERADVAIGSTQGARALVALGRGVEGSVVPLVQSALALVLPQHAGAPDIDDPAAIAQTLRSASIVVAPDAGLGVPGGAQASELLRRLQLDDELRGRIRYVADPKEIARRVASGAAQAGIGTMSEVIAAGEVRVLGPILEPRTDGVAYAALVVRPAASAGVAHSFLAHLRAPESQALFRKAGFLPLD